MSLSQVVTQPYDKISPQMQEQYYEASPYNLVRIILGKRTPADQPGDNPYTRAAAFLADWRREGILVQDAEPSLYRYSQRFTVPGGQTELERRGFIGLGRIEDYSAQVVFRHEQTLAKPKADRLDLLRATRAHFGQIFMLYSDPSRGNRGRAGFGPRCRHGNPRRIWRTAPGVEGLRSGGDQPGPRHDARQETDYRRRPSSL